MKILCLPELSDRLWGPPEFLYSSFPGVNRRGREVNPASPCSAEVKNRWSYTSTPTCLYAVDRENYDTEITAFLLKKT